MRIKRRHRQRDPGGADQVLRWWLSMMGRGLRTAVEFYIDGVVGGNLRAVAGRCVAKRVRQHTAGVADGRAALVAVFQPLIGRYDRRFVRPVRGFEDRNTVVLQTFQSFGYRDIERVTFDLFDTDDAGRITEHWSVSTPLAGVSASGCSQLDGPALVVDRDATVANKRIVAGYAADVLMAGRGEQAALYISPAMVEHDQAGADGCRHSLLVSGCGSERIGGRRIIRLAGSGNFVVVLSRMPAAMTACDLYRLDDGLIVEHWDVTQPDPVGGHGLRQPCAAATASDQLDARRPSPPTSQSPARTVADLRGARSTFRYA